MTQTPNNAGANVWVSLALVGQMGFIIALPAFAFGFGGAYLDKALGTSPLLLLAGLLAALAASGIVIYRRINSILALL